MHSHLGNWQGNLVEITSTGKVNWCEGGLDHLGERYDFFAVTLEACKVS